MNGDRLKTREAGPLDPSPRADHRRPSRFTPDVAAVPSVGDFAASDHGLAVRIGGLVFYCAGSVERECRPT